MQIKKAGVVATGALATVAVMGAPATAASHPDVSAFTNASTLNLARQGFDAPWDTEPRTFAAAGIGSVVNGAAWQICGSAVVAGVGGTLTADSPQTVLGDCNNGNILLKQDTLPPLFGALNDSAVTAGTWQICGSSAVAGVGGTVAFQSPNTVVGDCRNGNIMIGEPEARYPGESTTIGAEAVRQAATVGARQSLLNKTTAGKANRAAITARQAAAPRHINGWMSPWDTAEPQSLVSAGDGSAAQAATWQICGSSAVAGPGGVLNAQSPNTMLGDCDNANVMIHQQEPTGLVAAADNSSVNVAPWQICGSSTVAGVGGNAQFQSASTVFGNCNNANTVID